MSWRVSVADWSTQRVSAQAIRIEVFVLEQGVPIEMEWDEMDESSLHAIARDANGKAVGTGRLLPDGRIGRMAVIASQRRAGAGSAILDALLDAARTRGDRSVELHAQTAAESFYARRGFQRYGEEFMEAGIPHVPMRLSLKT